MIKILSQGVNLIAEERREQIEKHKWNDELNNNGQLIQAALYCLDFEHNEWAEDWSESAKAKIDAKTEIQRLTVAGALIAAEIDRRLKKGEK